MNYPITKDNILTKKAFEVFRQRSVDKWKRIIDNFEENNHEIHYRCGLCEWRSKAKLLSEISYLNRNYGLGTCIICPLSSLLGNEFCLNHPLFQHTDIKKAKEILALIEDLEGYDPIQDCPLDENGNFVPNTDWNE